MFKVTKRDFQSMDLGSMNLSFGTDGCMDLLYTPGLLTLCNGLGPLTLKKKVLADCWWCSLITDIYSCREVRKFCKNRESKNHVNQFHVI